jgi:uncharacterized protein YybS (DUF2232 family)
MIERRYSFEAIVAVAALAMFSASAVASIIAAGGAANLVKIAHDELTSGVARAQEFYKRAGMDASVGADVQAYVIDMTMRLSPALALVIAALAMLGNLRIVWRMAGPARVPYRLFGDMSRWSAPEWMVWLLLATGFAMFVPAGAATTIALNGFICVAAIYLFQGLAIMGFYFHALGVPSVVRVMIYFFLFFLAHLAGLALVSTAGLFDMWIDFRRLKPPREEAGSFGDFL